MKPNSPEPKKPKKKNRRGFLIFSLFLGVAVYFTVHLNLWNLRGVFNEAGGRKTITDSPKTVMTNVQTPELQPIKANLDIPRLDEICDVKNIELIKSFCALKFAVLSGGNFEKELEEFLAIFPDKKKEAYIECIDSLKTESGHGMSLLSTLIKDANEIFLNNKKSWVSRVSEATGNLFYGLVRVVKLDKKPKDEGAEQIELNTYNPEIKKIIHNLKHQEMEAAVCLVKKILDEDKNLDDRQINWLKSVIIRHLVLYNLNKLELLL